MLVRGIRQGKPLEMATGPSELEQAILAKGASRSRKFEAPEAARPKGRYATLQDAIAEFERVRGRTIAFVETYTDDLRARMTMHPLRGQVTCYECLLMVIMHPIRHSAQIEELKHAHQHASA